jgi:cold shock CspA family protein
MNIERGRVMFFNNEKGWGRILPDLPTAKEGDKTIFFHQNGGREIIETGMGELDFDFDIAVSRQPKPRDRVVYLSTDHRRGPVAFQWNFESTWKKAEAFINLRPWPWCPLCRIVRPDHRGGKAILWRGYYTLLLEALIKGDAETFIGQFLDTGDQWYDNVWCEALHLVGYEIISNPLNCHENAKKLFTLTPEEREHLEKFQVA